MSPDAQGAAPPHKGLLQSSQVIASNPSQNMYYTFQQVFIRHLRLHVILQPAAKFHPVLQLQQPRLSY